MALRAIEGDEDALEGGLQPGFLTRKRRSTRPGRVGTRQAESLRHERSTTACPRAPVAQALVPAASRLVSTPGR